LFKTVSFIMTFPRIYIYITSQIGSSLPAYTLIFSFLPSYGDFNKFKYSIFILI
jgi:hypothetical protein